METWKTCIDHNENYMISNYGNILSFKRYKVNGKILNPDKSRNGYLRIKFHDEVSCKYIRYTVHELVMYYFYGPRPKNLDIDHINRIRHDNRITNLRYCTRKENSRNTKTYRSDISEKDQKKRHLILKKLNQKKNRKQELCFCGCQRRFRFNHNTNSNVYMDFLKHLKSKKHKAFMNNFL